MPSAATIAGSASGRAKSRRMKARPGKPGCRDSARATKIAGTTDSTVESSGLPQREPARCARGRRRRRRAPRSRSRMPSAIRPGERPADQHGDGRQRQDAGQHARVDGGAGGHRSTSDAFRPACSYRLIAASHSSTQALRFAATSSGEKSSVFCRLDQFVEGRVERLVRGAGREHPVGLGDGVLEAGAGHEAQELRRQRIVRAGRRHAGDLDLQIVAFREGERLVAFGVLRDHVVGGRGGVGQHHRRLALGEQAIGLAPARRHRQHAVLAASPRPRGALSP